MDDKTNWQIGETRKFRVNYGQNGRGYSRQFDTKKDAFDYAQKVLVEGNANNVQIFRNDYL